MRITISCQENGELTYGELMRLRNTLNKVYKSKMKMTTEAVTIDLESVEELMEKNKDNNMPVINIRFTSPTLSQYALSDFLDATFDSLDMEDIEYVRTD